MQSEPRSFFFDENISEHLAQIVARFDRNNLIISHAEKFDKGTPDTVWIPEVASWSPKPVVVLGDGRVMRRSAEKLIVRESGLSFVVLASGWMNLSWDHQVWKFIRVWPSIRDTTKTREPTVFDVAVGAAKVDLRFRTSDLR